MKKKLKMIPIPLLFVFLIAYSLSAKNETPFFTGVKAENPLLKSDAIKAALMIQNASREIFKAVTPSVVRIETEATVKLQQNPIFNDPFFRRFFGDQPQRSQKQQGLGSGFVIHKDGYIVTNFHVINHADKITIKFTTGSTYEAKVIGSDEVSDLALLKIEPKHDLKPLLIGDSDEIEVGDFAIAIGNPFGLASTFTQGVISSKAQEIETADGIGRIQTDAAINPGNSGGPLLNIKGEVIGINQMIYSQSGGSIGIGFAIPISYAITVIEQLKSGKKIKPGYIGLAILPDPSEDQLDAVGAKNKTGLLVNHVEIGSTAWKSGVRAYDFILEIDGKEAKKFSVLKSTIIRKGAGSKVNLKVLREGKEISFNVEIAERKET